MLRFVEQFLLKQGLDYTIIDNHNDAIKRIKEYFKLEERSVPKIKASRIKNYTLNPEKRMITYNKNEIYLRKKEFELIYFMFLNRGAIIDRNTILEKVWGLQSNPFTNTVDVHMSHLRKKLIKNNIDIIKTIHGVGYKLQV